MDIDEIQRLWTFEFWGHQTLGRNKRWVIDRQKRLAPKNKSFNEKPKFMSGFLKVTGKNSRILKNVSKGCEYRCGGKGNWVTCPTCERFNYHDDCLKEMFRVRRKECPHLTEDSWKCAHCSVWSFLKFCYAIYLS